MIVQELTLHEFTWPIITSYCKLKHKVRLLLYCCRSSGRWRVWPNHRYIFQFATTKYFIKNKHGVAKQKKLLQLVPFLKKYHASNGLYKSLDQMAIRRFNESLKRQQQYHQDEPSLEELDDSCAALLYDTCLSKHHHFKTYYLRK